VPWAQESGVRVPSLEVWEGSGGGERRSPNSGIPELDVAAANGAVVVQSGRTRWKSEKAHFKLPKNHGSELTPNDGHGQQTLSLVFSLLHLLADVTQVVLAWGDRLSPRCHAQAARRELGNALRALVHALLVESGRPFLQISLEEADASP